MLEEFGLKMITLDLPFRLNHVNCFIAEGEHGWTVIDAGIHNHETVKRWDEELKGKEVTDILVTHYHPDHFGYVGGLQQKHNAQVSMTEIDANNGKTSWEEEFLSKLIENYLLAGVPSNISNKMKGNTEDFIAQVTPYPTINHHFEDGEKIQIGKFEYEVIFTPGHSDGMVTFYNEEKDTLLSTDHILPKITPNISYWFHGDPNPLGSYFKSLDKIKRLNVDFVIPSHGKPFHRANERIAEIKDHHDERLNRTLEIIKSGSTVFQTSEKLFNKKLNVHETRFAIGETVAHLEFLRRKGECYREIKNDRYWYYL
ncbi:MBL fold metallo-hydrolase [Oceanobacillus piezotolerans]|uniref:MBL fold metallo-hydrolase n=1 Tax=Oceanobacillus piezotolerans TaxID=2448030 RepID=A0A498D8G7_9BACI|nr:MBL fold metallo-hydrolase [Oceanobacillus piezotolerans]RLL46836.1 MBL fold metallo-hydrolase [Oceanobacillus piezotolerans]